MLDTVKKDSRQPPAKTSMHIYVRVFNGTTIKLDVEPSDTIGVIKRKIQQQTNIPVEQQRLTKDDLWFEDKDTVSSCRIASGSVIHVDYHTPSRFQVTVKICYTKIIQVEAQSSDTVYDLKNKVFNMEDILPEQQRLIFAGKIIHNHLTLSELRISHGSQIHLIITAPPRFQVEIVYARCRRFVMSVKLTDTVESLKKRIEDEQGIPVEQQSLHYGRLMENGHTLSDYVIFNRSSYSFILRRIDKQLT